MMHRCRYCHAAHGASFIALHEARCLQNPAVRAATLAALTDPDRPGVAIASDEYDRRAAQYGAIPRSTLRGMFGSWAATCAAFGLAVAPRPAPVDVSTRRKSAAAQEMAQAQEDAAMAAYEAMLLEQERRRGLPVCDKARVLPSGGVAWMVR
jgi:hypothetical protein